MTNEKMLKIVNFVMGEEEKTESPISDRNDSKAETKEKMRVTY